jgi:hypothetical protein
LLPGPLARAYQAQSATTIPESRSDLEPDGEVRIDRLAIPVILAAQPPAAAELRRDRLSPPVGQWAPLAAMSASRVLIWQMMSTPGTSSGTAHGSAVLAAADLELTRSGYWFRSRRAGRNRLPGSAEGCGSPAAAGWEPVT